MLVGRDRGNFQAQEVPPPHSPGTGPVPSGAAQRCPGEGALGSLGPGVQKEQEPRLRTVPQMEKGGNKVLTCPYLLKQ